MKKIKKYIVCIAGILIAFSSCAKHDPIDDMAIIGEQAANIYWEITNTVVQAGENVGFEVQYWSVNDNYEYLGVWYELAMSYAYTARFATFNYTLELEALEKARELQEAIELTQLHTLSNWVDSIRAYKFTSTFPTSHTLASTEVSEPSTYEEARIILSNFPDSFKEDFKEGIYPSLLDTLNSEKVLKMFTVDFPKSDTVTIMSFYKKEFDESSGREITVITEEGEEKFYEYLMSIPFDELLYNSDKFTYDFDYKRNFLVNSYFKIINGNGVENFTNPVKTITVN